MVGNLLQCEQLGAAQADATLTIARTDAQRLHDAAKGIESLAHLGGWRCRRGPRAPGHEDRGGHSRIKSDGSAAVRAGRRRGSVAWPVLAIVVDGCLAATPARAAFQPGPVHCVMAGHSPHGEYLHILHTRHDEAPAARYFIHVDRDEIIRVLRAFEASGLDYPLIGATARSWRALPATKSRWPSPWPSEQVLILRAGMRWIPGTGGRCVESLNVIHQPDPVRCVVLNTTDSSPCRVPRVASGLPGVSVMARDLDPECMVAGAGGVRRPYLSPPRSIMAGAGPPPPRARGCARLDLHVFRLRHVHRR